MTANQGELNSDKLERIIRRQIKAEAKTQLTDDVLLAAYQQEGSTRKAATFLTATLGASIAKDRIQAAIERAGGLAVVARRPPRAASMKPLRK